MLAVCVLWTALNAPWSVPTLRYLRAIFSVASACEAAIDSVSLCVCQRDSFPQSLICNHSVLQRYCFRGMLMSSKTLGISNGLSQHCPALCGTVIFWSINVGGSCWTTCYFRVLITFILTASQGLLLRDLHSRDRSLQQPRCHKAPIR